MTMKIVQVNYLYLLYLLLLRKAFCTHEILTVQRDNRIYCITADIETPIFILPPSTEEFNPALHFLKNAKWTNDDWLVRNASNFRQSPITDKRWEDFEIIKTDYKNFTFVNSLSFSIYAPLQVQFFIIYEDYSTRYTYNTNSKKYNQKWTHFTILSNNETVYIFENEELIRLIKIQNSVHQLVVKTEENTYWKIHDYAFKWAYSAHKQTPTSLMLPPTKKSCVLLYVSLCKECLLNVVVVSGDRINREEIRSTDTESSSMISWQTRRIGIEPNNLSTITFERRKFPGSVDDSGHWGIDIRQCPSVDRNNKLIYNIDLKKRKNRTCAFLTRNDDERRIRSEVELNKVFHCNPGMLGRKCDVSCTAVLGIGVTKKKCRKHRICNNFDCFCAWGYHGEFCQESCKSGTWGLSCKNICDSECKACHKKTGKCTIPTRSWLWFVAGTITWATIVALVLHFVRKQRLHSARRRVNASSHTTFNSGSH